MKAGQEYTNGITYSIDDSSPGKNYVDFDKNDNSHLLLTDFPNANTSVVIDANATIAGTPVSTHLNIPIYQSDTLITSTDPAYLGGSGETPVMSSTLTTFFDGKNVSQNVNTTYEKVTTDVSYTITQPTASSSGVITLSQIPSQDTYIEIKANYSTSSQILRIPVYALGTYNVILTSNTIRAGTGNKIDSFVYKDSVLVDSGLTYELDATSQTYAQVSASGEITMKAIGPNVDIDSTLVVKKDGTEVASANFKILSNYTYTIIPSSISLKSVGESLTLKTLRDGIDDNEDTFTYSLDDQDMTEYVTLTNNTLKLIKTVSTVQKVKINSTISSPSSIVVASITIDLVPEIQYEIYSSKPYIYKDGGDTATLTLFVNGLEITNQAIFAVTNSDKYVNVSKNVVSSNGKDFDYTDSPMAQNISATYNGNVVANININVLNVYPGELVKSDTGKD
jgi:hypothetical protein